VFGHPAREDGSVDRNAYTFCVLEQFYRHLKRREIYADASTRWRNPQAELLDGPAWEAVKQEVLTTLGLPEDPGALLAAHIRTLDATYREAGGRLKTNDAVDIDEDGKIHLSGVKAVEEAPSLVDPRKRTASMLPRVDLPEVILEVMSWEPGIPAAFTAVSGGRARLEDLDTSIAACLAAHAMNVGYRPIAKKGVPALESSRLSHVFQNYFRPETIGPANTPMVARQAGIALAQAWGGGMVAAVDGMRFVVPVPALFARPNRKFFGPKRGMTWLNAISDQGMGRGARVVSGTVRDSLHMVDVIFGLDGGELPEIVVSDTHSYSDLIFGILQLLGISYRPALADLPDQKGWRINAQADYGPLNTFARGKIDLARVRRHWGDILRVIASIYTGKVRAYEVVTMLQRDGLPHGTGRGPGRLRPDLQVAAHPGLHRRRRGLPPRHQAHPQPAGRPPRPGPHHLPRQEGRAVPPLRTRARKSARRARAGPQLRCPMDHGVPERRDHPAQGPGLSGARGGCRAAVPLRAQASGRARDVLVRPARLGARHHMRAPRPRRTR
jgi:Tn3 transposase DDE domain